MTARDSDLAALIDRQQVQDTVLKFATAVDTLDMALYRSIFAEEAEFDFSSFSGLLVLVLIFRPTGLLGRPEIEKV